MDYIIIALLIVVLICILYIIYLLIQRKETNKNNIDELINNNIQNISNMLLQRIEDKNKLLSKDFTSEFDKRDVALKE